MKRCTVCNELKALDSFHKRPESKDGHRADCKECKKKVNQKWKKSNPEKRKAYSEQYHLDNVVAIREKTKKWQRENREKCREGSRKYRKRHPERGAEYQQGYIEEHPDRYKAHYLVQNAIRSGKLTRPPICESCFNERFTEGHHEDYSKPLDVDWLCTKCHTELRRKVLV